jgi:hypothetical protein
MWDLAGSSGKAELYLGIAALLGTLACTGTIDGGKSSDGSSTPGVPGGGPGAHYPAGTNPGRSEMHRLNTKEYNASVADVLGTKLQPGNANWRGGEVDGFDNMASVLGVDETQYSLYLDAAEALATEFFMSSPLKSKFVTCAATDDTACVQSFVNKAGLHLFRRPLRPAEVTTYGKVYTAARAQGQDHEGSLKHVLWAQLASAEFLYRMEFPKGNAARTLDGFELASRLSYFLWTSAPDDGLLESAAANKLTTDAEIDAAVERMLEDAKSARFVEAFAGQWLGARAVASHPVAPDRFPSWNEAMATAAMNEVYAYFDDFLKSDRSWMEFLTTDVNFVNGALAPLYGIPNVTTMTTTRVTHTADERKGFLGLAGFLAVSSMDRRTSPSLRGKWVLGNLLCTEPPPPPKDVPKLDLAGQDLDNGNIIQILEQHRVRADCAGCHALFDPFGQALEKYDAIGQYRTTYKDGSQIDTSTDLAGVPFDGITGAAEIVTQQPGFSSCIAHKLFTYSLGRPPAGDDNAWIEGIEQQWKTGDLSIRRLIKSLALSTPFRNSGDVK